MHQTTAPTRDQILDYYLVARQTFGLVDLGQILRSRLKLGPRITLEEVITHHLLTLKMPTESITKEHCKALVESLLTEEERAK